MLSNSAIQAIHEYDPYFNFRSTKFLAANGEDSVDRVICPHLGANTVEISKYR